MPQLSFPANAEGLSKFSRRSILAGGAAVCATVVIPCLPPEEPPREELIRLFNELSLDGKREFLRFMRKLVAAKAF